jgi:glucose-1-phosphate thymidylyltransferase
MEKIDELKPSNRGEYEITDLINLYIDEDRCTSVSLNSWWIDAGTPERILDLEEKLL